MRTIAVIILLIALFVFGYRYIKQDSVLVKQDGPSISIGGEFKLQNQDGEWISNNNLLGKYTMIFFGFSRCPSICPTQLHLISQVLRKVNSNRLQAFFITIDPTYDTIERLKVFHENFDARIQMLTGPEKIIKKLANDYKVYIDVSDNPTATNHSAVLYIMGKDGKYLEHAMLSDHSMSENIDNIKNIMKNS